MGKLLNLNAYYVEIVFMTGEGKGSKGFLDFTGWGKTLKTLFLNHAIFLI